MAEDDDDLQPTAAIKGITDEDLEKKFFGAQQKVGPTVLGMQAIPRDEMRQILADRKARQEAEARHDTVPDSPPPAMSTPPQQPPRQPAPSQPPMDPNASGAYPRPDITQDIHPDPVQVSGTIKMVETVWGALVRQGLGIVVLGCVLAGFHFEYLAPGKRLGGPDVNQQKALDEKIENLSTRFGEVCEQVPETNVNTLTAIQNKVNSGLQSLKVKDRQRFMRLVYMMQDVTDVACSQGGKKWKKKWMREAEELLEEDERDSDDEDD